MIIMSDWVMNTARFSGDKEAIELLASTVTEGGRFNFDMINAIPEELRKISHLATVVSQEEYDSFSEEEKQGNRSFRRYITEKENAELVQKYGTNSWYNWSVKNWGTRWSGSNAGILSQREGEIIISFDTAWNEPSGIYETLENEFGLDILAGVIYKDENEFDLVRGDYKEFEKIFEVAEEKDYFDDEDEEEDGDNYYIIRYIQLRN